MSFSYSDFAAALKAGARISAEDVLGLRRQVWPDGSISADEADQLFELNRLARESDPEWADFFIEAMTDHVLNAKAPHAVVRTARTSVRRMRIAVSCAGAASPTCVSR